MAREGGETRQQLSNHVVRLFRSVLFSLLSCSGGSGGSVPVVSAVPVVSFR